MFRKLWEKIGRLWTLAKSERASPREIGWAVFIGAFAGCTPALGAHGVLAMGLATLFRKSRLFAWLGSRISNMVFLPFIALAEVQVAHYARTGTFLTIDRQHVIAEAPSMLLDWCLGTIPVGIAIGGALGSVAWAIAALRERRRARRGADAPTRDEGAEADRATADASNAPAAAGVTPPRSRA